MLRSIVYCAYREIVGKVELMTGADVTRCLPDYLEFGLE